MDSNEMEPNVVKLRDRSSGIRFALDVRDAPDIC